MSQDFHVWFDPKKYEKKGTKSNTHSPVNSNNFNSSQHYNLNSNVPNDTSNNYQNQQPSNTQMNSNNGNSFHNYSNMDQRYNPNFEKPKPSEFGIPPPTGNITGSNTSRLQDNQGFDPKVFDPIQETQSFIDQTINSPITSFGLSQAQSFVSSGYDKYKQNWFGSLRYYFSVNNHYVLNKMKILLFPYIHRSWGRKQTRTESGDVFLPPNEDINAPDFYIPIMAFITYINLVGLLMGFSEKGFQPNLLSITATTGLVSLFFEVLLIKLLFYLFLSDDKASSIPFLDIIAYSGYRFVTIIFILMIGVTHPMAFYGAYAFFTLLYAWFMLKTLGQWLVPVHESRMKTTRSYILIAIVLVQAAITYFLCCRYNEIFQSFRAIE